MGKIQESPLPDTAFWRAYQGRFSGLLNWDEVDAFWRALAGDAEGWFLFEPEGAAPEKPLSANALREFLAEAAALVNSRRERSHSGAVYVDDAEKPRMIKIFDPANMGAACAVSNRRTYPKWVLSRVPPEALPQPEPPARKGWRFGRRG